MCGSIRAVRCPGSDAHTIGRDGDEPAHHSPVPGPNHPTTTISHLCFICDAAFVSSCIEFSGLGNGTGQRH